MRDHCGIYPVYSLVPGMEPVLLVTFLDCVGVPRTLLVLHDV